MKILVVGGSGFIGKNLINKISENDLVFNFSRRNSCNLFDFETAKQKILDFSPDVVYNLASHGGSLHYVTKNAANVISDNIQMYLNLYKIVSELKVSPLVVNPISNCSYPGDSSIQSEDDWANGAPHKSVISFASSKRTLYYISKCYNLQYGINSINLIFPNAFGVFDNIDPNITHAMDGMIIRMLKAKSNVDPEFEVWGTGNPIREWIYSEDFASILLEAPGKIKDIEPINIAQGKGYKIKESVEFIKELCGYKGQIVFNTKYMDGDPVKVLCNKKFSLNFPDYKFLDHKEAILKTIKYYEGVL